MISNSFFLTFQIQLPLFSKVCNKVIFFFQIKLIIWYKNIYILVHLIFTKSFNYAVEIMIFFFNHWKYLLIFNIAIYAKVTEISKFIEHECTKLFYEIFVLLCMNSDAKLIILVKEIYFRYIQCLCIIVCFILRFLFGQRNAHLKFRLKSQFHQLYIYIYVLCVYAWVKVTLDKSNPLSKLLKFAYIWGGE